MENEKLIQEFEKRFDLAKKELKFKSDLEDINKIFYIKDYILKEGFVGKIVTRQICYRIIETFMGWNEYLHGLIMPNPQNMINLSESKVLSQEDKREATELIKKGMELISRNNLIGLTKDLKSEAKIIDDAVRLWEDEFKSSLIKIMKKINEEWGNKK